MGSEMGKSPMCTPMCVFIMREALNEKIYVSAHTAVGVPALRAGYLWVDHLTKLCTGYGCMGEQGWLCVTPVLTP
jgi:hypothetical protein